MYYLSASRNIWRYLRSNQKSKERQTMQWPEEKRTEKQTMQWPEEKRTEKQTMVNNKSTQKTRDWVPLTK